jgi:hypothetical protein
MTFKAMFLRNFKIHFVKDDPRINTKVRQTLCNANLIVVFIGLSSRHYDDNDEEEEEAFCDWGGLRKSQKE